MVKQTKCVISQIVSFGIRPIFERSAQSDNVATMKSRGSFKYTLKTKLLRSSDGPWVY